MQLYFDLAYAHGLAVQEGVIINVCSIAGLEPMKATPVYAASKWGLRGWSLSCYEVTMLLLPCLSDMPSICVMFNSDKCMHALLSMIWLS